MSKSSYIASNLFNFVNNGKIYEYKMEYSEEYRKDLQNCHNPLYNELESNFPKGFLTKLANFKTNKFFSVSFKATFSVNLVIREEIVEVKFNCKGELKDLGSYYEGMILKILSKSKLAKIGDYHFNPFETNHVSPEYSMMPVFNPKIDRTLDNFQICVQSKILFSPSKSLFDIIKTLLAKESDEDKINEMFVGSLVKVKYPAWNRYFRVLRLLPQSRLKDHMINVNGNQVNFLQFFKEKYPFLKIENQDQFLIEGEIINSRSEEVSKDREKRILIPEFLNMLIEHEEFKLIFGFDYYKKYKISQSLYKYFYGSRFIGNILEKPSVKKMITLWRLEIEQKSEILRFVKPSFYPEYMMVNPQGPSKLQRNLSEKSQEFYYQVLQHRMASFTQFKKWAVFCSKNILESVMKILKFLTECGDHFKYLSTKPECFFVESDSEKDWKDGLKNQMNKEFELILCFTEKNENNIKKTLIQYGLPFLVKKIKEEENIDLYYAHRLIHKIGASRYDHPWTICQLNESQPTMFCSMSINYLTQFDLFTITLVFSKNKYFTKYFQKILIIKNERSEKFEENAENEVNIFLARIGKFFRLNVVDLDFKSICYIVSEEERDNSKCRKLRKIITKNFEKLSCGSYLILHVSKIENYEFCPAGNRSVKDIKVMSYRIFDDFYRSERSLFKYFPECQYYDYSAQKSIKFLLMSKNDYINKNSQGPVYRYFVISSKNVDLEGSRKWLIDRTIMLSCVDFSTLEEFYGLPAVVVYAGKIVQLLGEVDEDFGGFVDKLNKFKYPVYVE